MPAAWQAHDGQRGTVARRLATQQLLHPGHLTDAMRPPLSGRHDDLGEPERHRLIRPWAGVAEAVDVEPVVRREATSPALRAARAPGRTCTLSTAISFRPAARRAATALRAEAL